jgi:hypothetical protein
MSFKEWFNWIFRGRLISLAGRVKALEHARHYHQNMYLVSVRTDEDERGEKSDESNRRDL